MRNLGSKNSIPFGSFCLCLFFAIFALSSTAFAGGGQLTLSPSTINFSGVTIGTSQIQAVTLTNPGGSKMTVSQATVSGTDFTLSGLKYPTTLSGGQSTTCYVTFSPQSTSGVSGDLSIWYSTQSNGKGHGGQQVTTSTVTVPMSGTGVGTGQLTTNPTSLIFGSVQLGNSQTLAATLTNSGAASLTISAVSTSSSFVVSGLSLPITLSASQSASFGVTFSPTSSGTVAGGMTITSNASNPTVTVPLSGTGITPGQVVASPTSLSFGSVAVGSSASLSQTLTNSGGSTLTISQITPGGTGFGMSGIVLPLSLAAGQSTTFSVSFAPQSGGSLAGNLAVSSTGSNSSLSVPLSGTGSLPGQLTLSPMSLNFGSVVVGTTQSQSGVLSAGSSAITVSSVGVSGSQFSVSGISLPVTIASGGSVSFQVAFAPQTAGAASSNITFVSNAANSPTVQSLSGTATAPQHSVALSWNTSTSSDVMGYNIYRGTVSGGPYTRINSSLTTAPYSTDSTVQGGQTYYYVTTAVDSTGMESTYSNQVQALIPIP